jgi:hypothetical protein
MTRAGFGVAAATLVLSACITSHASAQASADMNFFVAGVGAAWGADQPALVVSDQQCADLAYAQGFGHLTWHAYLDGESERARDRIGNGPWYNYYGVVIAESLEQLHSDDNNLWEESAVTETGDYPPEGLVIPKGSELAGGLYTRAGPFFCFGLAG